MNKKVRGEWRNRVIVEYASASILAELLTWLLRLGVSPDLLYKCHSAILDEMRHAEICREVFLSAGGSENQIQIHPNQLTIAHKPQDSLLIRAIHFTSDFLCCGETTAGRLFKAMIERAEVSKVKATLTSILKDEKKHADLGWELLEELIAILPYKEEEFVALKDELVAYTTKYLISPKTLVGFSDEEKSWGILDSIEYYKIAEACVSSTLIPKFDKVFATVARDKTMFTV